MNSEEKLKSRVVSHFFLIVLIEKKKKNEDRKVANEISIIKEMRTNWNSRILKRTYKSHMIFDHGQLKNAINETFTQVVMAWTLKVDLLFQ